MKISPVSSPKRAFTLLELLVAMSITALIVVSLVSITSIAIDTWNRSRSELRAARQAKSMVDTMARDFEALVTRRGTDQSEWLSAKAETSLEKSTSAVGLVFFTAATDRYNGEIGTTNDLGGDVSCVGYQLDWRDPIGGDFKTFVLNRHLVNPKAAFDTLLGKPNLADTFEAAHGTGLIQPESFVCENVFQFAVTFHIQVPETKTTSGTATTTIQNKLVTIGPSGSVQGLRIKGTGIVTEPADATLLSGRITSVGISLSVLSDAGIEQLRKSPARASDAAWLAKNSYQYSKLVQLPGM